MPAGLGHHNTRNASGVATRPQRTLLPIRQNLRPNSRGTGLNGACIISAALADQPIAGLNGSVSMIPEDFLKTLQPMGKIASVQDVVDAVLYLAQANQVAGEALHVDGGSQAGRW